MKEYIIVGDTNCYKECLIYVCGKSKDFAEQVLNKMQVAPTDTDKRMMSTHHNIKIKEIDSSQAWWREYTD